jgi:hypothetical protein
MDRRAFLAGTGALLALALPAAEADQEGKAYRIGLLGGASAMTSLRGRSGDFREEGL